MQLTTGILKGPSADAQWGKITFEAAAGRPQKFLFLPDAANDGLASSGMQPVRYLLPAAARLAEDASGAPVFSLTLVLSRQPWPHEASIEQLIQQAALSFDPSLAISPAVLEQLDLRDHVAYRPIFVRHGKFELHMEGAESTLASAQAAGMEARAALSANLNREQAIAVLSALNGQASGIRLDATVRYAVSRSAQTVHLHGSWARIHDYLSAHLADPGYFNRSALNEYLAGLLDEMILTMTDDAGEPVPDMDRNKIYPMFVRLAGIIMTRLTPELNGDDPGNFYALRPRPNDMFLLDYQETVTAADEAQTMISSDLSEVLGKRLPVGEWDRYVHLVVPGGPNGLTSAFRRDQAASQRRTLGEASSGPIKMAAGNRPLQSVALSIAPNTHTAESMLANHFLCPAAVEGLEANLQRTWLADDITCPAAIESLPLVDNIFSAVWRDRTNQSLYWYAPTFSLILPSPAQNPDLSPFLFEYRTTGVTAAGKPALCGTVRMGIRIEQSTASALELQRLGNPAARMVDVQSWFVALDVPFVDENNVMQSQVFTATVSRQGDTLTATVELLNDWVRLCYGAISTPGFQSQPARIHISYIFPVYMAAGGKEIQVVFGGKQAMIPVIYSPEEINKTREKLFFDAATANLRTPAGVMAMKREAPIQSRAGISAAMPVMRPIALSGSAARPLAARPAVVVRPQLTAVLPAAVNATVTYLRRSIARKESINAFFDCQTLGEFYREIREDGSHAIGCMDALKLGQTVYRQYDEMTDFRQEGYRVFRSLQQPGRFLVLPAQYSITRYEPGRDAAYRPCAILYSMLDAEDPGNSRIVFEASLQPDIAPFELAALRANLLAHAQAPVLVFPTEVMRDAAYKWTISGSITTPAVVEMADSLRIAVSTDLAGGMLLQTMLTTAGILGSVNFELPDGTLLPSTLSMDLKRIVGPWGYGPLSVTVIPGNILIANQIETTVTVTLLDHYRNGVLADQVTMEAVLSEGQSR